MSQSYVPFSCPLPFISVSFGTSGQQQVCCHSETPHSINNASLLPATITSQEDMVDPLNAKGLIEIRSQLLKGKIPKECLSCYEREQQGLDSARKLALRNYSHQYEKKLSKTSPNGKSEDGSLEFIDLSLGNKCNSYCITCHPYYSSQIAKWTQQQKTNPTLEKIEEFTKNQAFNLPSQQTKSFYFQGGEPLLSPKHESILEKLLPNAKKTSLSYNTNLTVLPPKVLSSWKEFKNIQVWISIDGIGEVQEYLRPPIKWERLTRNLALIRQLPNVEINFTSVVHALNLLSLNDIFTFAEKNSTQNKAPQLIFLETPALLKPDSLSKGSIEEAKKEWEGSRHNLTPSVSRDSIDKFFTKIKGAKTLSPYLLVFIRKLEKDYQLIRPDKVSKLLK